MEFIHYLHIPLYLFYLGLFCWLIYRWRFFESQGVDKRQLVSFLLLKVLAGIVLTLIYTYYYTDPAKADIHRYFRDGKIISNVLFVNPSAWLQIMTGIGMHSKEVYLYMLPTLYFTHHAGDLANNNQFIIRVISVCNYFSLYNIYINTLFFDLLSFIGLFLLFKSLKRFVTGLPQILYFLLFLIPSVIFWSSGLLKENILLFAIGLYLYSILRWCDDGKWKYLFGALVALCIMASIKLYIAGLLLLCSFVLPVPVSRNKKIIALAIGLALAWYFTGNNFCERIIDKRNNFVQLAITENAGSVVDNSITQPDCAHLFQLVPSTLVNSILRPFIWEGGKLFQRAFAIENTLLLALLVYLLFRYFKWPTGNKLRLAGFCFLFALLNYLVIGATVPVMGAIVHYRIISTVFMVMGVTLLLNKREVKTEQL